MSSPRIRLSRRADAADRTRADDSGEAGAAQEGRGPKKVQAEARTGGMTKPVLAPEEPVLDVDEIQGNVLPGFMKPNVILCALAISEAALAKSWLREIASRVTSLGATLESRARVRRLRTYRPHLAGTVGAIPETSTTPGSISASPETGLGSCSPGGHTKATLLASRTRPFRPGWRRGRRCLAIQPTPRLRATRQSGSSAAPAPRSTLCSRSVPTKLEKAHGYSGKCSGDRRTAASARCTSRAVRSSTRSGPNTSDFRMASRSRAYAAGSPLRLAIF